MMKRFVLHMFHILTHLWAGAQEFIKEHVTPTAKFLNAVKAVVENPAVDFITALTPTGLDDFLIQKIRGCVTAAIDVLEITTEIEAAKTPEEKMNLLIEYLKTLPKEKQHEKLFKICSVASGLMMGDKCKFNEVEKDLLTQIGYSHLTLTNK